MRSKPERHFRLLIALCASLIGPLAAAQTTALPPGLEALPTGPSSATQPPSPSASDGSVLHTPPAPQPIPGTAEIALPRGGMDAQTPRGLPINLATALQLAGVNPLDIAAATAQVRQALALYLQAKVLWIPNLNGGVDYFRHDGVQQNIFLGPNFRTDRQSFFVGGGPSLAVGLTDAVYNPLATRRVVASRRADLQAARNDVLFNVSQAFFNLQDARGRLLGIGAAIVRAELLVNFTTHLAPSLIAPLEINRSQTELQSLRQTQQLAIRDWRVASANSRRFFCSSRPRYWSPSSRPSFSSHSSPLANRSMSWFVSPFRTGPRSLRGASSSPRPTPFCAAKRHALSYPIFTC